MRCPGRMEYSVQRQTPRSHAYRLENKRSWHTMMRPPSSLRPTTDFRSTPKGQASCRSNQRSTRATYEMRWTKIGYSATNSSVLRPSESETCRPRCNRNVSMTAELLKMRTNMLALINKRNAMTASSTRICRSEMTSWITKTLMMMKN